MGLKTPRTKISNTLHYFLILELPLLIVTIALFAWSIDALRDALKFQQLAGGWRGAPGEQSGYGFELGTQNVTSTRTWTGASPLYTVRPATQTFQSYSYGDGTTATVTATRDYSQTSVTGSTTGTFTSTASYQIFPGYYGTAYYSDVYSRAGVQPSDLAQGGRSSSRTVQARATPAPVAVPAVQRRRAEPSPVPQLQRRDAGWGDGVTYKSTHDGLYDIYDDAESDYKYYIGCLAGCLGLYALRALVTIAYVIASFMHKDNSVEGSTNFAYWSSSAISFAANLAWPALCALGIAVWVRFGMYQGTGESSVQATIAFYAISALTTLFVVIVAICESIGIGRARKQQRQQGGGGAGVKSVGSSSSNVGAAA